MANKGDSVAKLVRIDRIVDRFEAELTAGRHPRIEEFLENAGADRAELLRELVLVDAAWRRRYGETVEMGAYVARFPELAPSNVEDTGAAERMDEVAGVREDSA